MKMGQTVNYTAPKYEIDKDYKEIEATWKLSGIVIFEGSDFVLVERHPSSDRCDHFCPIHSFGSNDYRGDKISKTTTK